MKQGSYLVIGLGRFGANVAKILFEYGQDVLAVDKDMAVVQSVIDSKLLANAMQIDTIDSSSLQKLGIDRFDAVILGIGSNVEDSVLTAANLKELNANQIVAKASSTMHGKILEKIGVDSVIYPEAEMGERVAKQFLGLNLLEEFALSENFSIAELPLPPKYASMTLAEADIRSDYHLNVLAIRRAGGHFNVSPTPKTSLQKDDCILVLGTHDDIENFKKL